MNKSLVVCFRFSDLRAEPEEHFSAARELVEQALARGAEPVATGIELYAFELSEDALEDAIELSIGVASPRASGAGLAVGISEGTLARSETDKVPLAWGPPLVGAALLACVAAPGEVLVDAALAAARAGHLLAHGARTAAQGGAHVHGLVLDKAEPWTAQGRAALGRAAPASPRRSAPPSESRNTPPSAPRGAPPLPRRAPPLPPRRAASPSLQPTEEVAPESEHDIDLLSSVPPLPSPAGGAVAALRTGDVDAVERLAENARVAQGRPELADRLDAMAHLARGRTADAIRRLELSAEAARRQGSADRCRASLALAVALATGGRHEDALFEALDALARAREMNDLRGERATLKFLSKLAGTVGQVDVAEGWAVLADG